VSGGFCAFRWTKRNGRERLGEIRSAPRKEKVTINAAATRMNLSSRSYHRIIKLARTIADLEGSEHIQEKHLLEAIGYREKK